MGRNSYYFTERNRLAKDAVSWSKKMEQFTALCPPTVITEYDENLPSQADGVATTTYYLNPLTTTEKLFSFLNGDDVAVLNFASYTNPGGMFYEGSSAQEESLCHTSNLYTLLSQQDAFYTRNRQENKNNGLYHNRALFLRGVWFFYWYQKIRTNVISCAAPNYSLAQKRMVSVEENNVALYDRCKFVLDIAKKEKIKHLILGAYGCGVFGQNPATVAQIFLQLLKSYSFDSVSFAIPNTGKSAINYDAFLYEMERVLKGVN